MIYIYIVVSYNMSRAACCLLVLRWATDLQKQLASRQVDKEAAEAELKRKEEAIQVRKRVEMHQKEMFKDLLSKDLIGVSCDSMCLEMCPKARRDEKRLREEEEAKKAQGSPL